MNLEHSKPIIGNNVFIAPNASVIGDVRLGDDSSVWYGSVLRGDKGAVNIGEGAAILERAVLNTSSGSVSVGSLARIDASSVISNPLSSAGARYFCCSSLLFDKTGVLV